MKGDNSRETFSQEKHYSSVRQQQGRAQLDANWNEQVAIQQHHDRTEAADVIGPVGVPDGDGFQVSSYTLQDGGASYLDLSIQPGRLYVDGILCEQDWPQDTHPISYGTQPYLPAPPYTRLVKLTDGSSQSILDIGTGDDQLNPGTTYVVYADVWDRHVGWVEDPTIREVALGGPDTATRTQTVWQLKIAVKDSYYEVRQEARLSARIDPQGTSDDLCRLSSATGYRGLENQLYRVEVHEGGNVETGAPTYKWSRDNGSVVARWSESVTNTHTIRVEVAGGTVAERFQPGTWIELTGDGRDFAGRPGVLAKVLYADSEGVLYDPTSVVVPADMAALIAETAPETIDIALFGTNPRVRRWDGYGPLVEGWLGNPGADQTWLPLEEGIQVHFWSVGDLAASYYPGQYWLIPARTATQNLEWPDEDGHPALLHARGILHHYGVLAELGVTIDGNSQAVALGDRRPLFCPLTRVSCEGSAELPQPGQYRCYQVDVDHGDDTLAAVGIGDTAAAAVAQATSMGRRFQSVAGVAKRMPRTGNDSIAMILIGRGTGAGSGEYHESPEILGLSGYRSIIIRGSDYSNSEDGDKRNCAAKSVGMFSVGSVPSVSDRDPYSYRSFSAGPQGAVQIPTDWRGARLTFVPNPWTGEQGKTGQTLTIQAVTPNDTGSQFNITVQESIIEQVGALQSGSDYFKIEIPSIHIDSLKLQVNASNAQSATGNGQSAVVLAGLRTSLEVCGMAGVGLAFVQADVKAVTSPLLSLQASPDYQDESGVFRSTSCAGAINLWSYGTSVVSLNQTVLNGVNVSDCESMSVTSCICVGGLTLTRCGVTVDQSALDSISWTRCKGTIRNVLALCEEETFFITLYEADGRLNVTGVTGGHGSGGIWLRFSQESTNCEVVVGDPAKLTDILMADDAPYDPRYLAVSDVRDSNGNHVQGSGGCVISGPGFVAEGSGVIDAFTLLAVKTDPTTGQRVFATAEPALDKPPLDIVGVAQNYNSGDTGTKEVRILTSGLVAISLGDSPMVPPQVVYLASMGRVGLDQHYQRIGILVAKKTTTGYDAHDVGIVALGR